MPSEEIINDNGFEKALLESLSHLRDVSLRDGNQSWDANKWPIKNILPCLRELDKLADMIQKRGGIFPPVEMWGGGQVSQPANFLKEDPLINLEEIHAAAPHIDLQCLYRGRQCFGYKPVSTEVQEAAIAAAADRGMKVFRVFDMMNDTSNLKPGIDAIKAYRTAHPQKTGIVIEGSVSYITEPEGKLRVWSLKDYADFAVKLAQMGCDEIVIKNYAGVGNWEMPDLIQEIRHGLDAAGFTGMPVNLHIHGKHPEKLRESLNAGASKVDVAFSALSDGPSHTDIMKVLKLLMKQKGFDVDNGYKNQFEHHPIVRQIEAVEKTIDAELTKTELKPKRPTELSQELVEKYRMAGGAISDIWSRTATAKPSFYTFIRRKNENRLGSAALLPAPVYIPRTDAPDLQQQRFREAIYNLILETSPSLWEKAGRFNTVTPGALILTIQAQQSVQNRMTGLPPSMMDYTEAYMDVVTGRYGENRGVEKLEEAKKFCNAVLLFRSLRKLNAALDSEVLTPSETSTLVPALVNITKVKATAKNGKIHFKLDDPELEINLAGADINRFRDILRSQEASAENPREKDLFQDMLCDATPGKTDPTAGLKRGAEIISSIETNQKINIDELHSNPNARLSSRRDLALLAMLLQKYASDGGDDDKIISGLVVAAKDRAAAPAAPPPGWTEPKTGMSGVAL